MRVSLKKQLLIGNSSSKIEKEMDIEFFSKIQKDLTEAKLSKQRAVTEWKEIFKQISEYFVSSQVNIVLLLDVIMAGKTLSRNDVEAVAYRMFNLTYKMLLERFYEFWKDRETVCCEEICQVCSDE